MQVVNVLRALFAHLDTCGISYMVGGSFASGAWGEPRHTNDLDIVAEMSYEQANCLVQHAEPSFLVGRQELEHAVSQYGEDASFQMLHIAAFFKVDVFVLPQTAFAQSSFARRVSIEIVPGLAADCTSPEDTVLQKLRWYAQGNRVSDRQWHDVVKILEIQHGRLDGDYLDKWAAELGPSELLADALAEAWLGS